MDISKLQSILTETSGNKFCPICGTPFTPYHSRQRTCGDPACKRELHNEYVRERTRRLKAEDPERWRKYHREAQRRYRDKKRRRIERDRELQDLNARWKKQAELDKKVEEYGLRYGEVSAQKVLAQVPKINVNLEDKDAKE